jgi:hypothetical protein
MELVQVGSALEGSEICRHMEFPRPACKPHSVHAGFPAPMTISLGCELPHISCSLPEAANLAVQVTSSHLPWDYLCLTLLQAGVTWPQALLPAPVVSYTTFSPLPYPSPLLNPLDLGEAKKGRSVSVALSVRLPRPGGYPAPCSSECGLSSMARSHRGHPVSLGSFIIP